MALVRKYKISKLLNKPLEGRDGEIIDFIKSKLSNLVIFNWIDNNSNRVYQSSSTYYMSQDGECVLEKTYRYVNIKYRTFISVLNNKYNLDNTEIDNILIYLIKDIFPEFNNFELGKAIPNAFKIESAFILKRAQDKRKI